jgi:phosphate starvation-inducible PhoH-like protein
VKEKLIELTNILAVELYGVNDKNVNELQKYYPKVKIIARGNVLKLVGLEADVDVLENKINVLIEHYEQYRKITLNDVERIVTQMHAEVQLENNTDNVHSDVLVFGNHGLMVKARTPNQLKMVQAIASNDMVFAIGPAGTGKTYTAVAIAVRALKNKEVRKIILTRPAVEAGENLGFLPGDLKEKLDPYLQPLYDALRDMIAPDKLFKYLEDGTIEIAPLAFMRGRTLDNAVVLLDEAQNATESQLRMFLTRMGRTAKFIITGDVTQIDLPRNQPSGLVQSIRVLKDVKGIAFIELDATDVIRHRLVRSIIQAYSNENNR